MICDIETCDGAKETAHKRQAAVNNILRGMVEVKPLKCNPCMPTSPECDQCDFFNSAPLNNNIKSLIICGFPGVGKTVAERKSREVVDCESTAFHYSFEPGKPDKENPDWVSKYVDHIENLASQGDYQYVLVSSHLEVRNEMDMRGIPYVCVVPYQRLLNEYLARYVKRGNSATFIKTVYDNWGKWLAEIDAHGAPVIHLAEGQNISDMIPQ